MLQSLLLKVFTLNLVVCDIECNERISSCRFCRVDLSGTIEESDGRLKFSFICAARHLRHDDVTVERVGVFGIRHFFQLRTNPVEPFSHLFGDFYTIRFDIDSHSIDGKYSVSRRRMQFRLLDDLPLLFEHHVVDCSYLSPNRDKDENGAASKRVCFCDTECCISTSKYRDEKNHDSNNPTITLPMCITFDS